MLRCWWDLVKSEHPASCRWVTDPALHLRQFCKFNNLRASVGGALLFLLEKKKRGILAFPIACHRRNSTSEKKYQLFFQLCMMKQYVCTLPVFLRAKISIPLPLFRVYLSEAILKIKYLLNPLECIQADQQGKVNVFLYLRWNFWTESNTQTT